MKEFEFTVAQKFNNAKALDFLLGSGVSSEIIKKVKFGNIYLNGTKLDNINTRVGVNDKIKIVLPTDQPNAYITAVKGDLNIVYEDEYMLAVVKERGVLTHNSHHNNAPSLDQLVCGYFLPNPFTFRAINRLDRDTSGIILIAKDMITASFLGELMKNGQIVKTYSAVVKGKPDKDHFFIEKPIKRQNENSMKRVVADDGKYAKSECHFVKSLDNGLSLMDITLHTGRTHQIRVHLSSIGLPLYADSLYGQKVEGQSYMLHAKSLQFTHPFTNEKIFLLSNVNI